MVTEMQCVTADDADSKVVEGCFDGGVFCIMVATAGAVAGEGGGGGEGRAPGDGQAKLMGGTEVGVRSKLNATAKGGGWRGAGPSQANGKLGSSNRGCEKKPTGLHIYIQHHCTFQDGYLCRVQR